MADITGMFQDPNAIRQARINDIAKQYQATANMGGSMNQLLGQVAASGSNVGSLMAEGAAGMFGMTTPEEAKAAQLNEMSGNFDLNTSEGLTAFAKQLNDMGMTKEAIMVMGKRDSVLDRERRIKAEDEKSTLEKAMREGKIREGVPRYEMRPRLDRDGKPVLVNGQPQYERVLVKTYERWDESKQRHVPVENTSNNDLVQIRLQQQEEFVKNNLNGSSNTPAASSSASGQMKRANRTYSTTPDVQEEQVTTGPRPRSRQ